MLSRLSLALLAAFASACAMGAPETEIDPRVTLLPHEPGRDVSVGDDLLVFPADGNGSLLGATPGDVLVSGAGEGFLRRVENVAIEGDSIFIHTTDAALDSAIVDGQIATTLALGYDDDLGIFDFGTLAVGMVDKTLIDSDALRAHVNRAELAITPTLDIDANIKNRKLEYFSLVFGGTATAEIDLELTLKRAQISPRVKMFSTPPQVFVQFIGWLPVAETVETEIGIQLEIAGEGAATVHLKGDAEVNLAGGAMYDGSWHKVADESHTFHGEIPFASLTVDEVSVRAYLYTEVNVKFYGLAGPVVNMGPYVQVNHPLGSSEWKPSVGLYGEIGGEVKAFGFNIPALPGIQLFDLNIPM